MVGAAGVTAADALWTGGAVVRELEGFDRGAAGRDVTVDGAAAIFPPQPLQKELSGGFGREHAGQIAAKRAPQPLQKAASSGFSR